MGAGLVKLEDLEMRMKAFKQYQVKHKYYVNVDEVKYSQEHYEYDSYGDESDKNCGD